MEIGRLEVAKRPISAGPILHSTRRFLLAFAFLTPFFTAFTSNLATFFAAFTSRPASFLSASASRHPSFGALSTAFLPSLSASCAPFLTPLCASSLLVAGGTGLLSLRFRGHRHCKPKRCRQPQ